VFCDVRLDTFMLDPDALAAAIGPRTVGIVPVHLFGACAEMPAVHAAAARAGAWVLEDAACAFGARRDGIHAGTSGAAGCFSFHPRKSITTGEGGMVVTGDAALAARTRSLRDHGASRSDFERHGAAGAFRMAEHDAIGFNYRMTDLQAALGCAQLERAEWLLAERARVAAAYAAALADLDWLRVPGVPPGQAHGWQAYVCLYAPEEPTPAAAERLGARRDALMAALERDGIATRPGTHAPPETTAYRERPGCFPGARMAARLSLALPLYPGMSEADQERVVEALRRHGP
jgi:perosamine synthetase